MADAIDRIPLSVSIYLIDILQINKKNCLRAKTTLFSTKGVLNPPSVIFITHIFSDVNIEQEKS